MMKRILIVDDESFTLDSLSSILRQDDTFVKAVSCAKDAISETDRIFYQLCFLDINLPDMNGLEVMKTVKKISPLTNIIIMTGGAVDPAMLKSIQENSVLLIPKPFDLDRIKWFVDHTLGRGTSSCQAGDQRSGETEPMGFENWLMDDKRQYEFLLTE